MLRALPTARTLTDEPLGQFVRLALAMLDAATPEPVRCELEASLQALLPILQDQGVFALFEIRAPALRALVDDALTDLASAAQP